MTWPLFFESCEEVPMPDRLRVTLVKKDMLVKIGKPLKIAFPDGGTYLDVPYTCLRVTGVEAYYDRVTIHGVVELERDYLTMKKGSHLSRLRYTTYNQDEVEVIQHATGQPMAPVS